MDYFIKLYKKKKGKDVRKDNRAVQKLRREVEKAKRALSSQHQARIEIESFFDGEDFSETLTRARFEELNLVSENRECQISHYSNRIVIIFSVNFSLPSPPMIITGIHFRVNFKLGFKAPFCIKH